MLKFRRIHESGTEALVQQDQDSVWRVQVNVRELGRKPTTITGYLVPTLEEAQRIADSKVLEFGHVCNACGGWEPQKI